MKRHVTENELAAWAAGTAEPDTTKHLAECPECADEAARLEQACHDFRVEITRLADRGAYFWSRLRAALRQQIQPRLMPPAWQWVAGLAALVMIASAGLFLGESPVERATHRTRVVASQTDPDRTLLIQVQQDLDREIPEALEPVGLLTTDMNRALQQGTGAERKPVRTGQGNGGVL